MQREFLNKVAELPKEFPVIFNREDIINLITELEDELEYLLSSCIKYSTGRIQIKSYYDKEAVEKYPELETGYGITYTTTSSIPGYQRNDFADGYFITKTPGVRRHGIRREERSFLLLGNENIYIDGDLSVLLDTDSPEKSFVSRIHFNRLRQLINEKRSKVIPEKVKSFFEWLEILTKYKFKLQEFGAYIKYNTYYYNRNKNIKCPENILSYIINMHTDGLLNNKTLPFIKDKLNEYQNKKKEVIQEGQTYLNSLKEINLANKTLQELKSARN
jgi:hypothetical protein